MKPLSARTIAARSNGLSLVELMCVATIAATVLGSAVPSLSDLGRRQRLQATAAELQADIGYARTIAIQRNAPVRLSWQALGDGGVCYMLHTGDADACDCAQGPQPQCRVGTEVIRTVAWSAREAITLTAATPSVQFDPRRSTVTPTATFKLGDGHGHRLNLIVNILGRVRSCAPGGSMAGMKPC